MAPSLVRNLVVTASDGTHVAEVGVGRDLEIGDVARVAGVAVGSCIGMLVEHERLRAGLEVAFEMAREPASVAAWREVPIQIGWDAAAQLLACSVTALKSRVNRGMYAEAIVKFGGKQRDGRRGGNSGSVTFDRAKLLAFRGGGR